MKPNFRLRGVVAGQTRMARTRMCCSTLSLRRTGDDLHVSLHTGYKFRLPGIVPVSLEFTVLTQHAMRPGMVATVQDGDDRLRKGKLSRCPSLHAYVSINQ